MLKLPHTRSCFVCGIHNPAGLRLDLETDGHGIRARFLPRPEHAGFVGVVHGGIIATVLDEVMAWACGVQARRFAFSAELTFRYMNPARVGGELVAFGEVVSNRRGRIFDTSSRIETADGLVVATGTGRYLPLPAELGAALQEDFADGPAAAQAALDAAAALTPPPAAAQ